MSVVVYRVMPLVREHRLFLLTAKLVVAIHEQDRVGLSHLFKCCEAMALVADTEDYNTYTTEYFDIKDSDDVGPLMKLHALCTKEFQSDSAHRSALRPLMDALGKVKRQASRK